MALFLFMMEIVFRYKMKYVFITLVIVSSFMWSGCAAILVGAAAGGVYAVAKKAASGASRLSERERKEREYREFNYDYNKLFSVIKDVIKARNFNIKSADSNKGKIAAEHKDLFVDVNISSDDKSKEILGVRLVIKNDNGIIENDVLYNQFFDDIKTKIGKNEKPDRGVKE